MSTNSLNLLAISAILSTAVSASNTTAFDSYHSKIYFRFQSGDISFEKWISIFTLCLAPLVTHIAFGFADPVILSTREPKWTDRIAQFNPTTITWRWFAIAHRRIQARSWDKADMAASNAIFWTGNRWDGSEAMMLRSREWITRLPSKTHVGVVSASSLATLAMTFQGIGTVRQLASVAGSASWQNTSVPLPSTFFPVTLLSLVRLPAAIWLSNDYAYGNPDTAVEEEEDTSLNTDYSTGFVQLQPHVQNPAPSRDFSFQNEIYTTKDLTSRLLPCNHLKSRLWRTLWLVLAVTVNGFGMYLCVSNNGPRPGIVIMQLSQLAFSILYFVLGASGMVIFVFYLLKGHATSTMLPFMNSKWYIALTVLIGVLAVIAVVLAALETKIGPGGEFQTYHVP